MELTHPYEDPVADLLWWRDYQGHEKPLAQSHDELQECLFMMPDVHDYLMEINVSQREQGKCFGGGCRGEKYDTALPPNTFLLSNIRFPLAFRECVVLFL